MVAPIGRSPVSVPTSTQTTRADTASQSQPATAAGYSSASSFQAAATTSEESSAPKIVSGDDFSQMLDDMLKGGNAGKAWLQSRGLTPQAVHSRVKKTKDDFDAWMKANPKATTEQVNAKVSEMQKKLASGGFIDQMIANMIDAGIKAANQHVSME